VYYSSSRSKQALVVTLCSIMLYYSTLCSHTTLQVAASKRWLLVCLCAPHSQLSLAWADMHHNAATAGISLCQRSKPVTQQQRPPSCGVLVPQTSGRSFVGRAPRASLRTATCTTKTSTKSARPTRHVGSGVGEGREEEGGGGDGGGPNGAAANTAVSHSQPHALTDRSTRG
jgi:hypothetical protein